MEREQGEETSDHFWEWKVEQTGVQATCQKCGTCLSVIYSQHPAERPVQLAHFLSAVIDAHELMCWGEIIAPWEN